MSNTKNNQNTEKVLAKFPLAAVYSGRRLAASGGEVFQTFTLPDGTELLYKGIRGVYIGHTYRCSAESIATWPERVPGAEVVVNGEWEARDSLAEAWLAKGRAKKKMAASHKPMVKKAMDALRPLVKGLPLYEHNALITHLAALLRDEKDSKK
jgi:hypothetical protein